LLIWDSSIHAAHIGVKEDQTLNINEILNLYSVYQHELLIFMNSSYR